MRKRTIGLIIPGLSLCLAAGACHDTSKGDSDSPRAETPAAVDNAGAPGLAGSDCAGVELAGDRDPAEKQHRLLDAVTTLSFNRDLLSDFGVDVVNFEATSASLEPHSLAVRPHQEAAFAAAGSCLHVSLDEGHFVEFAGGSVAHRGGPTLSHGGEAVSLAGFEIQPLGEDRRIALVAQDGATLFHGTMPHHDIDPESGLFDLFNVDLQVTEALATRWKRPELAGLVVGMLSMRAQIDGWDPSSVEIAPPPCGNWDGDVDVAMIGMSSVQQTYRGSGRVVITPSARLKNVGTANVPWYSKFSGTFEPYDNDQHPFLVWGLYREKNGIFEQLGYSHIKHAFLTINANCDASACRNSHILGLGCEDVYGVGTNLTPLGPRDEIKPHAGVWAHCNEPAPGTPSFFDQQAPFCVQDNSGGGLPPFTHRLSVDEAELGDSDANYYFTSWYVVRADVEPYNNMAWRKIVPSFSGSGWSFNFDSSFQNGSVLDAWIDPETPPAGSANGRVAVADAGNAQVVVQTKPLSRGFYKYAYTLHNHDFDPEIDSFTVPLAPGVEPRNLRFYDQDDRTSTDWTVEVVPGESITWRAPATFNQLKWTEMFTVSFAAEAAPVAGNVAITRADTGAQSVISSLGVGTAGALGQ